MGRCGERGLRQGHTIPSKEEIKDKKYCKWHNTWRHNTNNCVVFRNVIQDPIEKGRLKFPGKQKDVMLVDQNPFPDTMPVNMLTPKFKLVLDTSSEEPQRASVHNWLGKSQEPMPGSSNDQLLCARCHAELKGSGQSQKTPTLPLKKGRPKPRYPSHQRQVEGVQMPWSSCSYCSRFQDFLTFRCYTWNLPCLLS